MTIQVIIFFLAVLFQALNVHMKNIINIKIAKHTKSIKSDPFTLTEKLPQSANNKQRKPIIRIMADVVKQDFMIIINTPKTAYDFLFSL